AVRSARRERDESGTRRDASHPESIAAVNRSALVALLVCGTDATQRFDCVRHVHNRMKIKQVASTPRRRKLGDVPSLNGRARMNLDRLLNVLVLGGVGLVTGCGGGAGGTDDGQGSGGGDSKQGSNGPQTATSTNGASSASSAGAGGASSSSAGQGS